MDTFTASPTKKPRAATMLSLGQIMGALPKLRRDPLATLMQMRQRYGDIYGFRVPGQTVILLSHPDFMRHVLRDHAKNYLRENKIWDSARTVFGNGIFMSDGRPWLRQRRMMQPHFHRKRLAGLVSMMQTAIDDSLSDWEQYVDNGVVVDLVPEFQKLAMKVTVRTLFGDDLAREDAERIGADMTLILDYVLPAMVTTSLPRWLPVAGRARFKAAIGRIEDVLARVIDRKRNDELAGDDLLSMMMAATDEVDSQGMSNQQLRDETITIFMAGIEGMALSLSWLFFYLWSYPNVEQRLRNELSGLPARGVAQASDLRQLIYARQVFQEALRIRGPLYWLPRQAQEHDEIGGYEVPAGATVVPLLHVVHQHPDFWDAPERFNPDRFSTEQAGGRDPYAWLPFGAGPHLCIGNEFAMYEAILALASIVPRYRVEMLPGALPRAALLATLKFKSGVPARISRR